MPFFLSTRNSRFAPHRAADDRICVSGMRSRWRRTFAGLLVGLVGFAGTPAGSNAGGAMPAAPSQAVLHLVNDSFVAGELRENSQSSALRWQSPWFTSAFDFPLTGVSAVHFPAPAVLPKPSGEWCFELENGIVLFGSLVAWNGDELEIEATRIGRLHVKASSLHRFYRSRDSGDVVYLGPGGLAGWQVSPAAKAWREDFGHLATDQEGFAQANLGLPARAAVEFEISWKKKPDFVFSLGVGDDAASISQAIRFEVWGNELVVQRELEKEADPAEIQTIASGPGRIHLQVFLDQELGRCMVFSPNGSKLADVKVTAAVPRVYGGVRLENVRGDIRLERLRIARWTGDLPREVKADQPRVHRIDASIEYGRIVRYDAAAREFVVAGDAGESKISAARVDSAFLSFPAESTLPAVRVGYHDGIHVGGDLVKVAQGAIWMTTRAVREPLKLPLDGLRSLIVLRQDLPADPDGSEPVGMLELDGARLRGRLVDGQAEGDASCLVWHPVGSSTASPLRTGVSGRVVYREPPPPKPVQPQPPVQQRVRVLGGMGMGGMAAAQPARPAASKGGGQPSLYLRTGDTIPCEVTKIDETGVSFKTAVTDAGFVNHDKIKAVELIRDPTNAPGLTAAKRNRLLTLPRMQRDNPPTHLIRSRLGDYLRGRIVAMDDKEVKVEVRLETRTIPRDRIARIIWLHSEDLSSGSADDDTAEASELPQDSRDGRVQVLRSDGIRLTFVPEKFTEAALVGHSEVLGACRVAMKQIDQLLIGSAIEQAAAQLAYQKWKMQNAIDPKYVQAGESGDGENSGKESALVGKAAPAFELDLLAGGRFKLVDFKGRVVILDFWATWCGPCLAAMPQVERAAREFADQGVQLLAVNLEEAPKPIRSMLDRHKLDLTVALDRDGVVAGKYQATAIPQTVIIDRQGIISRVFIGANPQLEDQIRDALKELVESKPAQ